MNELIKVIVKDNKSVVSARELQLFVENNERFSKWIERMFSYGFVENVDYTPYQNVHPQNLQEITDYALTIECAKEISMLQRNEKGKQARLYFIECERKAKELLQPKTQLEVLYEIVGRMVQIEKLESQNAKEIKELDSRVSEVEAKQTTINTDYYTIAEYCKLIGKTDDRKQAAQLGKECSKVSKQTTKEIGKTYDTNFGEVNTYHKDILKKVII